MCNWFIAACFSAWRSEPDLPSHANISIYVVMLWARAGGQGRSVAARGDKQSIMGRCLALCSALNCLGAAREPWDLQLSGGTETNREEGEVWEETHGNVKMSLLNLSPLSRFLGRSGSNVLSLVLTFKWQRLRGRTVGSISTNLFYLLFQQ